MRYGSAAALAWCVSPVTLHNSRGSGEAAGAAKVLRKLGVFEHRHSWRAAAKTEFVPPRREPVVARLALTLGKRIDESVIHAGVDQAFRTERPQFPRIDAGIRIGVPGLAQEFDRVGGARARRHRPEHLMDVGGIDIVVDDDDVFPEQRGAAALRRQRHHLRGMSRIHLLDGNDGERAGGGFVYRPHAVDSGNPELFQIGPHGGRARGAPHKRIVARRAAADDGAGENGVYGQRLASG